MRFAGALLLVACLLASGGRAGPRESSEHGERLSLRFVDTEIGDVVRSIAESTGVPFLYDEALTLRGPITITGTDPVTREEALQLLDAALLLRGFAAFPAPGGTRRILHLSEAGARGVWTPGRLGSSETPVATLVRLRAADAEAVQAALRPLAGTSSFLLAYTASNSLILAGSENRLQRLLGLIQDLDRSAEQPIAVRRLRYRDADEAAHLLDAAFAGERSLRTWPDARSNAVLLRAPPPLLARARAFLARLDEPAESAGELRVLPLLNADPEALARQLTALGSDRSPETSADESLRGRSFSLTADRPTRSLVVRSDRDTFRVLRDVVESLDRNPPHVSVEVTVFEVSTEESLALGIDAFLPLTNPRNPDDPIVTFSSDPDGGGLQAGTDADTSFLSRFTREPLAVPIVDSASGQPVTVLLPRESAVVTADDRRVHSRLLMRPHLVLASGEEHELFAGDNIPVPVSRTDVAAGPFETTQDIERKDVGLRLELRPTVNEAGRVRLALDLEVSSLSATAAGDVDAVGPSFRKRHVTTTVSLRDHEIALLAGVREVALERTAAGARFLRSLPVLGNLFRSSRARRRATHLLVAIQTRVLHTRSDAAALAIRRRLGLERSLARLEPLTGADDTAYALLVTTRQRRDDADAIAAGLVQEGGVARVVPWRIEELDAERFDVYLTGLPSLPAAGAAALRLRERGWSPELRVIPPRSTRSG